MDDLSGLDWSSKPSGNQAKPPVMNPSFASLRPSPSPAPSGRSTPSSTQGNNTNAQFAKPAQPKPAGDSFSNLVNFGPGKATQNLTLAERQAQLEAEKRKKEEEKRKLAEAQFGSGSQWDSLGSRGTPSPALRQPTPSSTAASNDDDDLFAAFNKDTKVDKSSHYPPPESKSSTPANGTQLDLTNPSAWATSSKPASNTNTLAAEDDDPFGLSEFKSNNAPVQSQQTADDDDFLGDLGKPVEEVRRNRPTPHSRPEPGKPIEDGDSSSSDEYVPERQPQRSGGKSSDPAVDRTIAQLMDYGFSAEDARRGVIESGAGNNVQAVANWLLDDAHRKAKEKAQGRSSSANSNRPERREHQQSRTPEPDFAKSAAAVGNSLFKTANSLWKTGQKKMQQAVADFQQEGGGGGGDPSQPKWMRDAQAAAGSRTNPPADTNSTDEALMLESGGRPKPTRTSSKQAAPQAHRDASPASSSTSQSRNSPVPRWQQQSTPSLVSNAKSKLGRFADDDDFALPTSANRRRKPATPTEQPRQEPEPDLLFGGDASKPPQTLPQRPAQRQNAPSPAPRPAVKKTSTPPVRKAAPSRQIPPISADALQKSTKHRLDGTSHFKRGDFASAHASYSSSLSSVHPEHPLTIILLTNRALTALKTGEPKQAVSDADQAIKLIGPSNGHGETVSVTGEGGKEESRDMRELYGKALSRKAEALEQMEKWSDAAAVWQLCVEAGLGGPTAIKGRQRCQEALAPKPKPAPKPAAKPRPKPSASASLAPQKDSEAVTRLRAANEAAAREDDEKFALSETVDAKVAAWRDGKRDNLRALVSSLDKVLWEGSGWKTVGLHELVMANKVKIAYMKAIAKTHPDKIAQDASTEVRLIAGYVFSTLNEAWDKFKAENGL